MINEDALRRQRRDHGFESRWRPDLFFQHSLNCRGHRFKSRWLRKIFLRHRLKMQLKSLTTEIYLAALVCPTMSSTIRAVFIRHSTKQCVRNSSSPCLTDISEYWANFSKENQNWSYRSNPIYKIYTSKKLLTCSSNPSTSVCFICWAQR